ncbi:MAG: flagellar basal body protein, partial [Gaiellaceae bacterium]
MERGLFIAASGMLAELERQQRIANDLANVSTPGYKRDRVSQQGFSELLL